MSRFIDRRKQLRESIARALGNPIGPDGISIIIRLDSGEYYRITFAPLAQVRDVRLLMKQLDELVQELKWNSLPPDESLVFTRGWIPVLRFHNREVQLVNHKEPVAAHRTAAISMALLIWLQENDAKELVRLGEIDNDEELGSSKRDCSGIV